MGNSRSCVALSLHHNINGKSGKKLLRKRVAAKPFNVLRTNCPADKCRQERQTQKIELKLRRVPKRKAELV